jgi:hypothetical protein
MSGKITYYNGLTRIGNVRLDVETTTATFPAYLGIVAAAEDLTLSYYYMSLERDPRFNSVDYPTEFFDQIETALGITLASNDVFICTPIQNGLTKEQRQIQKLDISAATRLADSNPRSTYDITQLPNPYNNNDVDPDENPNLGELTLTPGVIRTGVYKVTYTGYHEDNVAFTDTATVTASTTANNFTIASIAETTTVLYTGYLLGTYTGDWTFTLTGDDSSYWWIGANAVSGYTTGNANAFANYNTTGTVTLAITAGTYYPIRLLYGNGPSGGYLNLTYSHTGQSATNDFTGKLFSPGVSLIEGRPWV